MVLAVFDDENNNCLTTNYPTLTLASLMVNTGEESCTASDGLFADSDLSETVTSSASEIFFSVNDCGTSSETTTDSDGRALMKFTANIRSDYPSSGAVTNVRSVSVIFY